MLLTVALLVTSTLALRSMAHALILRGLRAPRLAHQRTPADEGLGAESVRLPTADDKTLFAWFVAAAGQAPAPAVVVMHGWGANASLMLPSLAPLHTAGIAVLLLDARYHGQSDDAAFSSLPRFAEDIEAGLDWLRRHQLVDAKRLAVMGHSVGPGAALLCATRRPDVRAVISLSAFAHPHEIMRSFLAHAHIPYPVLGWYVMHHVQALIGARFDDIAPLASMARLRCPVLLVHGSDDAVVTVHGEVIAVQMPKSFGTPNVQQYWPFLALVLWFGYKWWNSRRVLALLPALKKRARRCLTCVPPRNLPAAMRRARSISPCRSWAAAWRKFPSRPRWCCAAPAARAVAWPACCWVDTRLGQPGAWAVGP